MNKSESGVSFVVPVYNKATYLPEVLLAIQNQRGDFEREFIFIDDGSTDESLTLLKKLTSKWKHVRIIEQKNHGSSHATNQGIMAARLSYIKFVDADDLLGEYATKTLLNGLEQNPQACLAYGDVQRYKDRNDIDLSFYTDQPEIHQIHNPLKAALKNSLFNPTQFLARTTACQKVGGCDERIRYSQEYTLTIRLALEGDFVKVHMPMAYLPEEVTGRLSNNVGRQLQRVTMACANFMRDHPQVPREIKKFVCHRAAGRSWKYLHRHHGESHFSKWFYYSIASYFVPDRKTVSFLENCAQAFDKAEQNVHI